MALDLAGLWLGLVELRGSNALGNFANLQFLKHLELLFLTLILYFFCFKIYFFAQKFFYRMKFNPLQPGVALLYPPESIRKPLGFLMFSGGIEKQQQAAMG